MFAGCSKDTKTDDKSKVSTKAIATINGEDEISLEEYKLVLDQMALQFEVMYGPDVWDQEVEGGTVVDLVKNNAWETVKNSTISSLVAKDKGIELTDEEIKEIEKSAKEYMKKKMVVIMRIKNLLSLIF